MSENESEVMDAQGASATRHGKIGRDCDGAISNRSSPE